MGKYKSFNDDLINNKLFFGGLIKVFARKFSETELETIVSSSINSDSLLYENKDTILLFFQDTSKNINLEKKQIANVSKIEVNVILDIFIKKYVSICYKSISILYKFLSIIFFGGFIGLVLYFQSESALYAVIAGALSGILYVIFLFFVIPTHFFPKKQIYKGRMHLISKYLPFYNQLEYEKNEAGYKIEERLARLNELFQKGLIDEKEHIDKKEALLNSYISLDVSEKPTSDKHNIEMQECPSISTPLFVWYVIFPGWALIFIFIYLYKGCKTKAKQASFAVIIQIILIVLIIYILNL